MQASFASHYAWPSWRGLFWTSLSFAGLGAPIRALYEVTQAVPCSLSRFKKGLYYNKDGERWKLATIAGLVTRMIAIRLDTVTRPFSLKPRGLFSIPLACYAPFRFRPRFHWRCTPLAGNGWQLKAGGGAYASTGRHTPAAGRCALSPVPVHRAARAYLHYLHPPPCQPSQPPIQLPKYSHYTMTAIYEYDLKAWRTFYCIIFYFTTTPSQYLTELRAIVFLYCFNKKINQL